MTRPDRTRQGHEGRQEGSSEPELAYDSGTTERDPTTVLALTILCGFVVLYLVVRWYRLLTVGGSFDLTLLGNVLWRLANGLDSQTALTGGHYISTHASPIVALFAGLLPVIPGPLLWPFLIVQAISVGLVAWAGNLVGRYVGLTSTNRLWLMVCTLSSSAAWIVTQHQANETTLGIGPLAMLLAHAIRNDSTGRILTWAVIAASCRIEMAAAVLVAGIVIWSYGRARKGRAIVGVATVFLAAYIAWLFTNPYPTESVAAHFAHLGDTPKEALSAALREPWTLLRPLWDPQLLAPFLLWLLPFGLLPPLAGLRWLLVALPPAAIAILGIWPPADNPIEHYWVAFLAAGSVAAPIALSRSTWLASRMKVLLVASLAAGWIMLVPYSEVFVPSVSLSSSDRALTRTVAGMEDAYIVAPIMIAHHLVDRPLLAPFPRPFFCAENSVGPYTAPSIPPDIIVMPVHARDSLTPDTSARIAKLLNSYVVIARSDHFVAWQIASNPAPGDYLPCSSTTFTPSR